MCDAVEEVTGTRPGIKWTNDLVCGSRKIAGILTEMALDSSGNVSYAVIGVGINCSQQEADFPPEIRSIAGSLSMVTGQAVSRSGLAAAMIRALQRMDAQLLTHTDEMLDAYRQDCITLGQEVSILRGNTVTHGRAVDIDAQGALIVRYSDGHSETVNSGEVSVRGMYGYV
jgi:BirA family biotin operon repressor/biotin-[acetyl-CoA-carboxylase] ligase